MYCQKIYLVDATYKYPGSSHGEHESVITYNPDHHIEEIRDRTIKRMYFDRRPSTIVHSENHIITCRELTWNKKVYDCKNCIDNTAIKYHMSWDTSPCSKDKYDGGFSYNQKIKSPRCNKCHQCCTLTISLRMCEYFKILQLAKEMNIPIPEHKIGYMPMNPPVGHQVSKDDWYEAKYCIFLQKGKYKNDYKCRLYDTWRPIICQNYLCKKARKS